MAFRPGCRTLSKLSLNDKQNNIGDTFWNRFEWRKARLMVTCTLFCFINMVFHEQILRSVPKSSNFIAFSQHVFISICGFATIGVPFGFGKNKPLVPIRFYFPLVILNFLAILTNNLSHNYGISIPLNMIFKSSSLVANMLLGMIFLRHRYSFNKFVSVIGITFGLVLCTIEDYRLKHSLDFYEIVSHFLNWNQKNSNMGNWKTDNVGTTTIGICLITISFLLSAGLGIYQEYLSRNFPKNPNESLYYVHLLTLPIFLLNSNDILYHFKLFAGIKNSDESSSELSNSTDDQFLLLYLSLLILTQYLCIHFVYVLISECNSLSVTLCVTNRKFLSLIFSIFYFGNPFTIWHWLGSFIVFGGTICFYLIDELFLPKTQIKHKDEAEGKYKVDEDDDIDRSISSRQSKTLKKRSKFQN